MKIFVYSDESGVFDKVHNDYYVYGGLMFLSKDDKDIWSRKYINAENVVRNKEKISPGAEVKASSISNGSKSSLYRSLNQAEKFGVVISQKRLLDPLFQDKKSKQRYLDWAYKMGVKTKFNCLINSQRIVPCDVEELYFFVDEHTTATNGRYELEAALEQEFKLGTYNPKWDYFYPPIFPKLQHVSVEYCNSAVRTLVRAADIVANRLFHLAASNGGRVDDNSRLTVYTHPNP